MIDEELRKALAVDPSPAFLARVREQIASKPAPWAWHWSWTIAVVGAAAVVLAVDAMSWKQQTQVATRNLGLSARTLAIGSVSVAPLGQPTVNGARHRDAEGAPARQAVGHANRQRAEAGGPPPSEPEVLISQAEARAIRNLLADVREGRIDLSSLPVEPSPFEEIIFAPITMPPVTVSSSGEGVRQ